MRARSSNYMSVCHPDKAKARAVIEPLITILSDSLNPACLAASLFLSLRELEMEMRCESREEEPL